MKRWSMVAGIAALAMFGAWLLLDSGKKERAAGVHDWEEADETERTAEPAPIAKPPPPRPRPTATSTPPSRVDDYEVVGPAPDDPHEPGMVPHPLDAEHERIDHENRLIQSLNDAMSFRKVKEMRAMLEEYKKLDPADEDASQAGYKVIADCIEFPGPASMTAAHQFYDTERHSPLRRFVRRICFENSN